MMKEKVIAFLNPIHVVRNAKEFFEFQVTKISPLWLKQCKFAFQQLANF